NSPISIPVLENDYAVTKGARLDSSTLSILGSSIPGSTIVTNPITKTISYTPPTDFAGVDTIRYSICHDQATGQCAEAYLVMTVLSATAPNSTVASDDLAIVYKGNTASGNVSVNDIDPEGNTMTVTPQSNVVIPSQGTFNLDASGNYTFVPDPNFLGTIDFPYQTCDNGTPSACANATLHITVRENKTPDLTPTFVIDNIAFQDTGSRDALVQIIELNGTATDVNIPVIIGIPK